MEDNENMDKAVWIKEMCILFMIYVLGQLIWECDLQCILIKRDGNF